MRRFGDWEGRIGCVTGRMNWHVERLRGTGNQGLKSLSDVESEVGKPRNWTPPRSGRRWYNLTCEGQRWQLMT